MRSSAAAPATLPPAPAAAGEAERVPLAAAPSLLPAWRALAAAAAEPNVFAGPEFLPPRLAAFAPEAELLAVRRDGRLAALAPVVRMRPGFGLGGSLATLWSNDYAPLGVPLVAADDPVGAWTALLAGIGRTDGALVMLDQRLDGPAFAAFEAAAARLGLGWRAHGEHARAALAGGVAPAEYRAGAIEKRRRHEYARQWRRLGERGRLESDAIREPDAVREVFEAFLALEAAGWKGRAGTAMLQDAAAAAFARRAVADLAATGGVALDRIRLDGRPIAMLVRLSSGGRAWPWKIAYAEDVAHYSPGLHVMLEATDRLLGDPGFRAADSLAVAGHPMIDHLWRDRIRIGTVVVDLAGGGLRARLGSADLDAWLALKRAARAARERIRREWARFGR